MNTLNRKQQCYSALNGHYPNQIGVIYYKGIRVTREDFKRIKRGGR